MLCVIDCSYRLVVGMPRFFRAQGLDSYLKKLKVSICTRRKCTCMVGEDVFWCWL